MDVIVWVVLILDQTKQSSLPTIWAAAMAAQSAPKAVVQPKPDGTLNDDQMSTVAAVKSDIGGQFITGMVELAVATNPSPLLLPATAIIHLQVGH